MSQQDTIAAISTPIGAGAIGILRLSGAQAINVAEKSFRPIDGKPLTAHPPRTLVYGRLLDEGGETIDMALCTYSPAPATYTGEDTAEVQCHGSPLLLTAGLAALFANGARQATAGEFTRRAFLNGKLDLMQAEAVGDLLEAKSHESVRNSAGQLAGALSSRIDGIYSALLDVMAHFHAVLDYPDEDIATFELDALAETLAQQQRALGQLLDSCRRGKQLTQGISCAIVGRPNAGKSSLLNALAGYERAIVTDIAGTTRDTIDLNVQLGGLPICLTDTAGLRESSDPIERLGVQRSRAAMERAELIFVLWDSTREILPEDEQLLHSARELAPVILIHTKCDLQSVNTPRPAIDPAIVAVSISAKTGEGLTELEQAVAALFPREPNTAYGQLLTNQRQEEAAKRAYDAITRGQTALMAGVTADALLTDIEAALSALGELTGQTVREDITNRIFAKFCVGK